MGRPEFQWTREKSNRIMVLFAAGYKQRAVAEIVGCDVKTLRKTFSLECKHQERAELILRSGMMVKLLQLAEEGNVGASKQLERMLESEKVRVASKTVRDRKDQAPAKPEVLGKKEMAKRDAAQLSGRYATRQPPSGLTLQ